MAAFGERIGVAFQLADDLVDIGSERAQSGKTPGTDLREGVPTLAVLYARTSTDPADARLIELTSGPIHDDAEHAEALAPAAGAPGDGRARDEAHRWADEARVPLAPLPAGPPATPSRCSATTWSSGPVDGGWATSAADGPGSPPA